jgi:hypothetical protein
MGSDDCKAVTKSEGEAPGTAHGAGLWSFAARACEVTGGSPFCRNRDISAIAAAAAIADSSSLLQYFHVQAESLANVR